MLKEGVLWLLQKLGIYFIFFTLPSNRLPYFLCVLILPLTLKFEKATTNGSAVVLDDILLLAEMNTAQQNNYVQGRKC